jgi:hypothetical protein
MPQYQDFGFQPPPRLEAVAQHAAKRKAIAIMRRSCSDSLLTASQVDGVFGSDTGLGHGSEQGWRNSDRRCRLRRPDRGSARGNIKVKLPTAHVEQEAARKVYDERRIPISTPAERVRHVLDRAFAGRRIVIFSGGATVFDDDKLLDEIRSIHAGGGFGSIIGRSSFQRPKEEALRMLGSIMDIYAVASERTRTH